MFEISDAVGGYKGTVIVRNANLQVNSGEIVAVLGRNGVGKTTLMKYAMGLCVRFAGKVLLDGAELPYLTPKLAKRGLGYVPQGRYVFSRLTVAENISAAAVACGHDSRTGIEAVFSDFPMLGPKSNVLAGKLSGGQQQILAIGRALATQPKVLILDEPTEGVQPSIVDEIAGTLLRLNRERNLAIVVAEQNLDFCLSLAQRAYIMSGGTTVRDVTSEELRADTALQHEMLSVGRRRFRKKFLFGFALDYLGCSDAI